MKLKTILLIAGAAALVIFAIWFNALLKDNKRKSIEITRLQNNQDALLAREKSYILLNLTQKEALQASSLKIDSLSTLLKIKPKAIERIIYQTIIQHDTTIKTVEVEKVGMNVWKLKDTDKCFTWQGVATLFKDSLSLSRTRFDYLNETVNTFWKTRRFWIFSKWHHYQQSLSTCGQSFTKEILIKKK